MDKRLAVLQHGGHFVAGVFSDLGLFSTSIPRNSIKSAITSLRADKIPREDRSEDLGILKYVFDVMNGLQVRLNRIRFDFSGLSPKQIAVLNATKAIPLGKTRTYGEVAGDAGLPNAPRFVGNVMASNRFAPLIPCHRVVAASGLGGYGFGIATKKELLSKEGAFAD
jgi:O-6-methylguanine DNA methyltransferase